MTPLAMEIVKQILLKPSHRTFVDQCGLLDRMDDIHCFDVTEIGPLVDDLRGRFFSMSDEYLQNNEMFFLPAPKTWIEWSVGNGRRGLLLEQDAGSSFCRCYWAAKHFESGRASSDAKIGKLFLGGSSVSRSQILASPPKFIKDGDGGDGERAGWINGIYSSLVIINSPRIVGRRQHMPHRGLERRMLQERKNVGKFPLHAYTEILLRVTPPKDASNEESHEAHLTGQRALHFCRAHLRVRMGKLEVVKAHWRGDPSLGIKRSRYKVAA